MFETKTIFKALSVALTLVLATSCFFFPKEEPILAPPTIKADEATYATYIVRRGEIVSKATTTGYVVSKTSSDCFFTDYSANLKAVYVRPGDEVSEGDLIAELDVGELEFDVETARLNAELATLNYNSSNSTEALLNMELAENNYNQLKSRLDGSKIYARISGRVSFVEILKPGEEINPYRTLVKIVDPNELRVEAEAANSVTYSLNDEVIINVEELSFNGYISRTPIEARFEGAQDVNALWAEFSEEDRDKDNQPTFELLGKRADIVLIRGKSEDAIIIPKNLVKTLGERTYVVLYEDGEKREADVVTGISNAVEIEIVSGLQAGQEIVVK